jgi:hypothetical protein
VRAERAERERLLGGLRSELELERSHAAHRLRAVAVLAAELDALKVAARGQATRIRLQALREAALVSGRARELAGSPEPGDELFAALADAIERLGAAGEGGEEPPAGPAAELLDAEAPSSADPRPPATVNGVGGSRDSDPGAAASANGAEANGGAEVEGAGRRLSVDVGPFRDFSQLVNFEDAANAIGGAGEVSIRRFSEGRASIDLDLSEPIDLLRELEERCDLEFRVRSRSDDEIILDLGE